MHFVEDYQGGAAIIIRIHHAIGDGMALVGLMLSVMDGGDLALWTAHSKAEPPAWLSLPGIKTLQKSLGITTSFCGKRQPWLPTLEKRLDLGQAWRGNSRGCC